MTHYKHRENDGGEVELRPISGLICEMVNSTFVTETSGKSKTYGSKTITLDEFLQLNL